MNLNCNDEIKIIFIILRLNNTDSDSNQCMHNRWYEYHLNKWKI